MLEHMPVRPFIPPQFGIKTATEPWEWDAYFRLRHSVFCDEQRLFPGDDRDALDDAATPIIAVSYVMGMAESVAGTVRIHETSPRHWTGSRLAIDPRYRGAYGLGAGLVYRAVASAQALGCDEFFATVQRQNVPFFRRLHWRSLRELDLHGAPHTLMIADLDAYPALPKHAPAALVEVCRAS
jgi:putative N-acetyltransferase (TIGR04045 family)